MYDKNVEKTGLFVFLVHHIFMSIGAIYFKFPSWVPAVCILTGIASVVIVVGKSWEHASRALFLSIMVNISLLTYGSQTDTIFSFLLPFLGITVIVGLFGIPKLMSIPAIVLTFLIFYHRYSIASFKVRDIHEFYTYFVPIFNAYFIVFILYFWNIKRKEAAGQLKNMINDLEAAKHGKDDFIANVSHEIRTPVNNIVGMSEVVLREELPDSVIDSVMGIQTSGKHLVSIVSDILDYSELQSEKMKLYEDEYNFEVMMRDIIATVDVLKGDKDIDVMYDCDGSLPLYLIGDQQKITRIILNLMSNAIKFTNEGLIVLKVSFRPETYGINLAVTVSDTGIGMDEKEIEQLYSDYNQVDTKRNRKEGGIGLGMIITRSIVELMGGVISVSSRKGDGTAVKVVIPQKISSEERLVKPFPLGTVNMLSYHDENHFDNIKIRDQYLNAVSDIAAYMNINFHRCHNCAELLRRCEKEMPEFIFLGFTEYNNNQGILDKLSTNCRIIVFLSKYQAKYIKNDRIIQLFHPLYIGSFVEAINPDNIYKNKRFTAPKAQILVVDDNTVNLKVVKGLLSPYKMTVTTATSGVEALELIDRVQYDLIFMDHMMPGMDGVETLKRIRNKNSLYYKEVPVIALTANAVAGAREMFIEEGFQEFISKPIDSVVLEKNLRYFLADKLEYVLDENTANTVETLPETSPDESEATDRNLGDLNVKSGIDFCGSYENLIEILQIHCDEGEENYSKIDGFYQNRDWKNYAILVHGLKSSMKSVGADELSAMAKELEFAAKDENEELIDSKHCIMMDEYNRVLGILYNYFGKNSEESKASDLSGLKELSETEFEEFISEFESASYTWDDSLIRQKTEILEKRYYKEVSLTSLYEKVMNKVEMTDYLSAVELVKKWKDKIDREA